LVTISRVLSNEDGKRLFVAGLCGLTAEKIGIVEGKIGGFTTGRTGENW